MLPGPGLLADWLLCFNRLCSLQTRLRPAHDSQFSTLTAQEELSYLATNTGVSTQLK